ncbi:PIR Superfamily Protein [Plasmodium ovale curtisi]|uniref:PIR Superfamily Protein n=1 Tax=Plasmodium ovale curtisi TaxID=864141 RepID=A0A1A8XE35_PLAOA|nr:PIR Superfamily Protein [Plasmodium ovale curtisi]
MSVPINNLEYVEFEGKYDFLKTLIFSQIYQKFTHEYKTDTDGDTYCNEVKENLTIPDGYIDNISHFCNVLYHILANVRKWKNDLYDEITDDDRMYCISLKYWLYEEKENLPFYSNIDNAFESLKNKLEDKLNVKLSVPCTFTELNLNDIKKLRQIYAFALIYYSNIKIFKEQTNIYCKYLSYLGSGLRAYYESDKECNKEKNESNFCKEFKEFQKTYMGDNIYVNTSRDYLDYHFREEDTENCPLVIESLKDPLRLMYKEGIDRWYLSDQPVVSLNSSIVSASSAIGATVGLSAFILYLFKFTNIGSLFGRGKQKDHTIFLNVDAGRHGFAFPISEQEQANFGNSEYNIAYYSAGNF